MEEEKKVAKFCKKVGDCYFCAICNKQLATCSGTRRHVEIVHQKQKKYACPKCGTKVSVKSNLARHVCRDGDNGYRGKEHIIQQRVAALTNGKNRLFAMLVALMCYPQHM